ncbi:uncharacterized protein BDZ99DRAFT_466038, partial [Mytilinidion resinicola]
MASPFSESLPAPETTSEEAPLLDSSDPSSEPPLLPRPQLRKPILILTWLSLALAATTWPFLIALKVLWINDDDHRDYHYSWGIRDDAAALLGLSITAAIFAALNLLRLRFSRLHLPLPLAINLVVDAVLAFYLIAVSATGISDGLQGGCYKSWYPPPPIGDPDTPSVPAPPAPRPVDPACYVYAYRVLVLQEVVMSVAVVL